MAPAATVASGTTVQWLIPSSTGPNQESEDRAISTFGTKYAAQGIRVEKMQSASGQAFNDLRLSVFASGTAPDLVYTLPLQVAPFQEKRLLKSLSPFMRRDKYDLGDFFPAGWDQYRYSPDGKPMGAAGAAGGGDIYGTPKDFPTRVLGYNASAFTEGGVKLPAAKVGDAAWTWQAFVDAASRLLRRGDGPNGVARWGWHGHENWNEWLPWLFNNGADLVSPDGRESKFDDPKVIETFQFLSDLQHRQQVSPTPQQRASEPAPNQLFATGRLAMIHFGPANIGTFKSTAQGFEWDVAVWPRGKGPATAAGLGSGWFVPASTKNPDATWLFVQHLVGPDVQRINAEMGTGVPVRRSTMETVFIRQPAPPKSIRVFMDLADAAKRMPQVPKWDDMLAIVERELGQLWQGQGAARDICLRIKQLADVALKAS